MMSTYGRETLNSLKVIRQSKVDWVSRKVGHENAIPTSIAPIAQVLRDTKGRVMILQTAWANGGLHILPFLCNYTMLSEGMKRKLLIGRKARGTHTAAKIGHILFGGILLTVELPSKNLQLAHNVGVVMFDFPCKFFLHHLFLACSLNS